MRLLQTSLNENLKNTIHQWATTLPDRDACALFHIYVPYDQEGLKDTTDHVRNILKKEAPNIPVIGCSATGEIMDGGMYDSDIVISLMIFEKADTRVEVLPFYDMKMAPDKLYEYAGNIPDLKGIEILSAAPYQQMEIITDAIDALPEEIEVFGGVAVGDDTHSPFVFANESKYSSDGAAFVFYSGKELHMLTYRMFGWKAIGYPLKVTNADGPVVYEVDGKPAYDVYDHYLHIKKGGNFFYDALEFPWEVQVDEETKYIRHAKSVNPDGSIVMSSNIPKGSDIRLTYGDPRRIFEHTKQTGLLIRDFAPQVVNVFNCMGRKLFWGGNEDVEIAEISRHLQTTGFSALGEIMRYKSSTVLNNLSIVTVAMREGPVSKAVDIDVEKIEQASNMPITARLAIFINTISDELMDKNAQLNDMLYKASHDALTGLLNRGAIERIIYEAADAGWYLIMLDVDDFKQINDQYGHTSGDHILRIMAKTLSEHAAPFPHVEAGRWGGEEFMIFVSGHTPQEVKEIAESLRLKVKNNAEMPVKATISVGVTSHRSGENQLETIDRADELMYKAKENGKDRVCDDLS